MRALKKLKNGSDIEVGTLGSNLGFVALVIATINLRNYLLTYNNISIYKDMTNPSTISSIMHLPNELLLFRNKIKEV